MADSFIQYNVRGPEDISPFLSEIKPNAGRYLTSMFLKSDEATSQIKAEWMDYNSRDLFSTLTAGVNNSVTTIPILDAAKKPLFASDTNWKCIIDIDDEKMIVTGISGDNLTVTRAANGTTAAAHSSGALVTISRMMVEGADYTVHTAETGTSKFNWTQIFPAHIKLSDTLQAIDTIGSLGKIEKQVKLHMELMLEMIEEKAITGVRWADGVDNTTRTMGGMRDFSTKITALNLAGSTVITENLLQKAVLKLLTNGADPNNLEVLIPNELYPGFSQFKLDKVIGGGLANSERTIDADFDEYKYADAPLKLVRHNKMKRVGEIIFYDASKFSIHPLQGRALKSEKLGKKGSNEAMLMEGEYTCRVRNGAECFLTVTGVTLT